MFTRRDLLRRSAFLSLAPVVPEFLDRTTRAATPDRDGRVLVVLQLDGGNDGINTVVPFGDENYNKHRRELRIPTDKVLKVGEGIGLHPSMRAAADLIESHRLAIVQGVGYPNPDRSHFESMAVWQTAMPGKPDAANLGWLGRALDAAPRGDGPALIHVGDENIPRALFSRRAASTSFADASDLALRLPPPPAESATSTDDLTAFVNRTVATAYATAADLEAAAAKPDGGARYPGSGLAKRFELVARSIKAKSPARVYYLIQGGYDTHSVQAPAQSALLRELADALRAFLDDLAASKLADRVAVLAFSEFGRRPEENGSLGTDHGTAGPVFVAGPSVQSGIVGQAPSLGDLENDDLKWSIDFRSVYATLLDGWLNLPADEILGGRFSRPMILKT
ncbi:DUF1501 domain-containing protein [Paludisphaera borealis]|uniref:DUF1501 domain-containing protein n=1 Tax=Paludisphaera borealis TaxID=1387353 RepID=A0A1U7CXT7_9BACT|nr:DUF1501 domain-containing protein [Paludisphaera borealis]APW63708.1 hypothetical protein BSF38_05282 [Paludisphaera borealis]